MQIVRIGCLLICWHLLCALPVWAADRILANADGVSVVLTPGSTANFFQYRSEQHPCGVDVPHLFTTLEAVADDGNGFTLNDASGDMRFSLSAGRLAGPLTIRDFYDSERRDLGVKPAYETVNKDFFVLSWVEKGRIHYRKVLLKADTMCELTISYPESRKKELNLPLTHSAKSLRYVE